MTARLAAIIGAATAAAFGVWVKKRRRHGGPVTLLGQAGHLHVDDDRAAEIIGQFAPVLRQIAQEHR